MNHVLSLLHYSITTNLTFQGEFLKLLQEEEQNITWKSYIYAVPRRVMVFAIVASTNSLATPDNLARWGKVVDFSCKLCLEQDKPKTRTAATLVPGAQTEQLSQDAGQV